MPDQSMTQAELRETLLDGVREGIVVALWDQPRRTIIYKHVEHTDNAEIARKLSAAEIMALWEQGYE